MNNKNEKTLADFTRYCKENPTLRFWQALVSWSGYNFIYVSMADKNIANAFSDKCLEDTFYKEEK